MSAPTLRAICVASVLFGIALTLLGEGRARRAASLCVTAALVLMFLSLLRGMDWESYALGLAELRSAAEAIAPAAEAEQKRLSRLVIERECEEYIMDKAAELSLPLRRAEVEARWDRAGVWVPERAKLTLEEDAEGRARLSALIEAQLGIAREKQEWSIEGDS